MPGACAPELVESNQGQLVEQLVHVMEAGLECCMCGCACRG